MGGYMIPLEGQRAPVMNPYQAAEQGEQFAAQQDQQQLQRQLTQEQIEAAQTNNAQQQIQLEQMRRQQANQALLREGLASIYAPASSPSQPVAPPNPAAPPPAPVSNDPTAADYLNSGLTAMNPYAPPPTAPPGPVPADAQRPIVSAPLAAQNPASISGAPAGLDRQQQLVNYLTEHGADPQFVSQLQQGILAAREQYAKAAKEENALQATKHASQNALLQGTFSTVDAEGNRVWQNATPQSLNGFLQRAQAQNLLAPGDVQAILQEHPDGNIPADTLRHYSGTLELGKEMAEQALHEAQTKEALANQQKTEVGNRMAIRDDASSQLASQQTYGDYQNLRADLVKVHPELAGAFSPLADRDPDTPISPDDRRLIRSSGQTAQQQEQTEIFQQNADTRQQQAEGMVDARNTANQIAQQVADNKAEMIALRRTMAGQTANSLAVDVRQARAEYLKQLTQEGILQRQRLAIASALGQQQKTGTPPQDKNGDPRDLQSEMNQVTDQLEELLVNKHDAAQRAGITPPVSLDKALTNIGRRAPGTGGPLTVLPGQPGPAAPSLPAGLQNNPPAAAPPPAAPAAHPAPAPVAPPAAAAPPKETPKPGPTVGQKFSNGKMTVTWNGTQYIDDATGKPAKFQ